MARYCYPFTAIVGQERVKNALLYNLIEPRIGGVLLCGEKGAAKSTIVRGMAALTDQKVVNLPLSVTEDMLVGSIDFERAVKEGVRCFSGGLLARAHGNILYVDEVNLLPDTIVSTLICAAASGENLVEREGISHRHDSHFVLVGTMNPEEGRLRPQFLDRFGLYVDVVGEQDPEVRAEIIRRRMAYEHGPEAFCQAWQEESDSLCRRIQKAKTIVKEIQPDKAARDLAAQYIQKAGTEGNRCEVVLIHTAAAVAAWKGRSYITNEDLKEAATYVFPHRQRREQDTQPKEQKKSSGTEEKNEEDGQENRREEQDSHSAPAPPEQIHEQQEGNDGEECEIPPPEIREGGRDEEQLVEGEQVMQLSLLPVLPRDQTPRRGSGRRNKTKSGANRGRYASATAHPFAQQRDLALDATLRSAAPYQSLRCHDNCAVALVDSDLRFKIREDHVGATIIFVVDASGSMGAQKRMKAAKEAILSMLLDSYQKRDRIGLVAFRKDGAETLLDITASVDLAQKKLQTLPTGGRTPLAAGLFHSWQLLKARRIKDPELLPMLVLVTDGRANRPLWTEDAVKDAKRAAELIRRDNIHVVVIDTEKDFVSLHIARQLAEVMDAAYYKVDELQANQLRSIVKSRSPLACLDA